MLNSNFVLKICSLSPYSKATRPISLKKYLVKKNKEWTPVHSTSLKLNLHIVYIFRMALNFLIKFGNLIKLKFSQKHFDTTMIKTWNTFTCGNHHYSLLHTIYEFPGMIWSWYLHWRYSLINKIAKGSYNVSNWYYVRKFIDSMC